MSTFTKVKTSLRDSKSIGEGAAAFMAELIKDREGKDVKVSFKAGEAMVRMHHASDERAKVNGGVLAFSDIPYDVGFNQETDGTVSVVYDSYVHSGLLSRRINDPKLKSKECGALKQCQGLHNLRKTMASSSLGSRRSISHRVKNGNFQAFIS